MAPWKEISAPELEQALKGSSPPLILDVRMEEDRACCHLPAAKGNCVYEVDFEERLQHLAPDHSRPICVYGAASDSAESRMAAEKLARLGYTAVLDFRGGIDAWREAGFPTGGTESFARPPVMADGDYPVDLSESQIHWTGRNLLNHHEGSISLKAGWLRFTGGRLVGGGFVIDMKAIQCRDLAGDALHHVLIRHLLSHDFFDSDKFPEATFGITAAHPIDTAAAGAPNLRIHGNLCLKGISLPISFNAASGITPLGKAAAQATLAFDRTLWNVLYGSGKYFRNPGGHLVNDLIELQLRIVTC